jgi:hypothetical protein
VKKKKNGFYEGKAVKLKSILYYRIIDVAGKYGVIVFLLH